MGKTQLRLAVLTSSRADYGIYLPLLKKLKQDKFFHFEIVAFGTHLSQNHGFTVSQIENDGFEVPHKLDTLPKGDEALDIACCIGETTKTFSKFWEGQKSNYDTVLCLGDRYEMFAAIMAGVPFGISFTHFHGGETTFGAFDEIFRHSISLASTTHFTSTQGYAERLANILGHDKQVFCSGALSLDNLADIDFFGKDEFNQKFGVRLKENLVLATLHPETSNTENNKALINSFCEALARFKRYNFLITMPNTDTSNILFRNKIIELAENNEHVEIVESLGTRGYFTALKASDFIIGNSSSGIIEAASFGKYVINIGDRQKGRLAGENVKHVPSNIESISNIILEVEKLGAYRGGNVYYCGGASDFVIKELKNLYA